MALDQLVGSTTQNGPMGMLQPGMSSVFPVGGGGGLASIGDQLPQLPFRPPGFGISPMPVRPGPIMGLQPAMPDYSSQFEKFGEQLTGFGDQ